jgi:hypothetical protein
MEDIIGMPYEEYHRRVVEECVKIMGEKNREFFDKVCSYHEEYEAGELPEDVANYQYESLT